MSEEEEDDDSKEWQKLPIITFQTFDDLTGTRTSQRGSIEAETTHFFYFTQN